MKQETNFKFAASVIQIISVMIALMLIIISSSAFSFFVAAMIPSIIAAFLDNNKDRCGSGTICTFNLIGVMVFLDKIWGSSDVDNTSRQILSDVQTWVLVCGASVAGLLLYLSFPHLIVKISEAKNSILVARYKKQAKEISEEWNLDYEE